MAIPPQKPTLANAAQIMNPMSRNPELRERLQAHVAQGKSPGMAGLALVVDKRLNRLANRGPNPGVVQAVVGNKEDDAKKRRDNSMQRMKCGGKAKKMAKGGKVRGDGIAKKGKTKGRMV